jgi:uncharacterized protein (DUF2237 family)
MRMSNELVCLRIDPLTGYYEHGNETVGFLKFGYVVVN